MLSLPRGTLLNTASVAVGGLIGWGIGANIPTTYQTVAMGGIGLFVVGLGIKMFFEAKHALIVLGAIVFGGMFGLLLGFQHGIELFGEWAKNTFGGSHGSKVDEVIVSTCILFCVGPLTLLGCLQDGVENKIDLLAVKSAMDGVGAIFFAAGLGRDGWGLLVTAGVLLIVQSLLTFLAKPLQPLAQDPELMSEITGSGGIILVGIALGLLEIKHLPMAGYLPALVLAPLGVVLMRKMKSREESGKRNEE